jgi:hypothetical protein
MPKTRDTVEVPPDEGPKATLLQLKDLMSLMEEGKLEWEDMEEFLHPGLSSARPDSSRKSMPENLLLKKVEEITRRQEAMSKAPPLMGQASTDNKKPKATLLQLRDLITLMSEGKIAWEYMQDFLRPQVARLASIASSGKFVLGDILLQAEKITREHYPHAVSEIMEVLAPFCDPYLDLEFKPLNQTKQMKVPEHELNLSRVRDVLFWLPVKRVKPLFLGANYHPLGSREVPCQGEPFGNQMSKMFAKLFWTYGNLKTLRHKAGEIIHGSGLHDHIGYSLNATTAVRYRRIVPYEHEYRGILYSIIGALDNAIILASTKREEERLKKAVDFLNYQRSGQPICHWYDGTAYFLAAKSSE